MFNYAISDSANLVLEQNSTGNVVLRTPYANKTDIEFSSSQVYAKAKGVDAVRFDYDRKGKLVAEFEVFDLKWLAVLLGGTWATGAQDVFKAEYLTVNTTNKVTLSAEPNTGTLSIFKLEADNIGHSDEQTAGETTAENKYTITEAEVTFNATSCPSGTKVVAYYMVTDADVESFSIKLNDYPEAYTLYADTMITRKHDGVKDFIQYQANNAKPVSQFTISMQTGGVTTLSAEFDLFPDANEDMLIMKKI